MSDTSSLNSIHLQDKPPSRPSSIRLPFPTSPYITRPPHSENFWDAVGRSVYVRILGAGCLAIVLVIFAVFSIYWGALWKIPVHQLGGVVVDLDGGPLGGAITSALLEATQHDSPVRWERWTTDESGADELVRQERAWVAVVVNANASQALEDASVAYNPATAVTVFASEARNENAYRNFIMPSTEAVLRAASSKFAETRLMSLSPTRAAELATTAPQALLRPISHSVVNLAPFDIPVATAMDFVGLIFILILSFFIVMIGASAREISGMEKRLKTSSLIKMRLTSVFCAYFAISLFYSLLSLAFQVDFTRTFGRAGFVVFWLCSFVGMLSVGLLLEAMITLLTPRFLPFFLITWVIVNVSVASMPLDILPTFFKYGYAMPFYNISASVRTILFGTRNQLGLHFGVLLAWAVFSAGLLVLLQWLQRRSEARRRCPSPYEFD